MLNRIVRASRWLGQRQVAFTNRPSPTGCSKASFMGSEALTTKVSDGSQPPMNFGLSLIESAGSRSLDDLSGRRDPFTTCSRPPPGS